MKIRFSPTALLCAGFLSTALPTVSAAMPSLVDSEKGAASASPRDLCFNGTKSSIAELAASYYSTAMTSKSPKQQEEDLARRKAIKGPMMHPDGPSVEELEKEWLKTRNFTNEELEEELADDPSFSNEGKDILALIDEKMKSYNEVLSDKQMPELVVYLGCLEKYYTLLLTSSRKTAKLYSPKEIWQRKYYRHYNERYFTQIMLNFPGTKRVNYLLACINVIDALKKHLEDFLDHKQD